MVKETNETGKAKRLAKEEAARAKRKVVPSVPEGSVTKAVKRKGGEIVKRKLQQRRAKRRAKGRERVRSRNLVADARQEATENARKDVKKDLVSEFEGEKEARLRQRLKSRGLLKEQSEEQQTEQQNQRSLPNLVGSPQNDPLSDIDQGLEEMDERMSLTSSEFSEFQPGNSLIDDSPTNMGAGSDLDIDLSGID